MINIVIPCLNENENIEPLFLEIDNVFNKITHEFQIIYVDDGSTDSTWNEIVRLRENNNNVKGIKLSRNFGHQAAISAGISESDADATIIMDCDFQDDPKYIDDLIRKWEDGFDVVLAKRIGREEGLFRRIIFGTFFKLQKYFSDIDIPENVGHFSLLNRESIKNINNLEENSTYMNGVRAYIGFKVGYVDVVKKKRKFGDTKMSYRSLVRLGLQGIFEFSSKPLTLIALVGILVSFGSILVSIYSLIHKVRFGTTILGWDFGLSSIYFLSGIQLLSLSIIGKYVGNIFSEVKKRPNFIIDKKI